MKTSILKLIITSLLLSFISVKSHGVETNQESNNEEIKGKEVMDYLCANPKIHARIQLLANYQEKIIQTIKVVEIMEELKTLLKIDQHNYITILKAARKKTIDEVLKEYFESAENLFNKIGKIEVHPLDQILKMGNGWIKHTGNYCVDIMAYCEHSVEHH